MRLPSPEELNVLYQHFNARYFDDTLPPAETVRIEFSARLTASAGICYPKRKIIRLSTHYHQRFPEDVPATLLHEMIHLKVQGHGPLFKSWLQRIQSKGGAVALKSKERATTPSYRWIYRCAHCRLDYFRMKRLPAGGRAYRCRRCRRQLQEIPLSGHKPD